MAELAQTWLSEPAIIGLLSLLLTRLDRLPSCDRIRPPSIRVNAKTVPQLFDAPNPGDPAYLWGLIERLEELGWITIRQGKRRMGKAAYEVEPTLLLTCSCEEAIRTAIGREAKACSYHTHWSRALSRVMGMTGELRNYLVKRPIRVPGHSAEAVVERLMRLPALEHETLFLREVSSRLFWRHAKTLDRRAELVARILGKPTCPFQELPVLIHSHCEVDVPNGILFVENVPTFLSERLRQRAAQLGFALILAAGFKLTALRLRSFHGSRLFHSTASSEHATASCIRIQAWLHGRTDPWPVYFWGDLDFSSMDILKRLRVSFPTMVAWQEGYAPMAAHLLNGEGFHAVEVEGKIQVDPGQTGCEYADFELLPLLRKTGLFAHQEY